MPLMRAIVGLPMCRSRSCISMNAPIQRQYWPLVDAHPCLLVEVGAGAERAIARPGHDDDRHRSSQEACSKARDSSRIVGKSRALRTSGRSIVTVATPASASRS